MNADPHHGVGWQEARLELPHAGIRVVACVSVLLHGGAISMFVADHGLRR
jgi:hypothetical protein